MRDASWIAPAADGSYPLREGNAVRPLVDGEPAFRRICEAVDAARKSVRITVAFLESDMQMPDGRGTFFDVVDRAAARGLDVRVLFWREPEVEAQVHDAEIFDGTPQQQAWLRARGSRIRARWDRVSGHCHHQKSWIVDAGALGEVAFVGGINLGRGSLTTPGHPPIDVGREGRNIHDLYVEIRGPAATDVVHNFAQRWNEASERGAPDGAYPDLRTADDLAFPATPGPPAGEVPVQVTRTVRKGLYRDGTPPPGGKPYPIAGGERSILEQYLTAIRAARRSIYLENQVLLCPDTIGALEEALSRGVAVVVLAPGIAMPEIAEARRNPRADPLFRMLAGLGRHAHFLLAGLAANRAAGAYEDVYVHAKAALVDDAWGTIGSANTLYRSLRSDTEMNASFWHVPTARALRVALLREHLTLDTSGLDDREAFRRYRDVALGNRERRARGEPLRGQAFALDPATWAGGRGAEPGATIGA